MSKIDHIVVYGQYFTPQMLADFMVSLATTSKSDLVIDPAAGEGVFLKSLAKNGFTKMVGYEVDDTLQNKNLEIIHKSFVTEKLATPVSLIIGNPPYVRWKNLPESLKEELKIDIVWNTYCNSLCDYLYIFILRSIELLKDGGELIFITPDYWLVTLHAQKMRDYITRQGYVTHIFQFKETPLFTGVSSSLVIFRFIKTSRREKNDTQIRVVQFYSQKKMTETILVDLLSGAETDQKKIFYLDQFEQNTQWLLAPKIVKEEIEMYEKQCLDQKLGDIADIGNGMVSGLDKTFQVKNDDKLTRGEEEHLLRVVKAKQLNQFFHADETPYLWVNDIMDEESLSSLFPHFFKQLTGEKAKLEKRYMYNRHIPYWHWVFLRNYKLFQKNVPRIFIPCKERISHKKYFRFAYIPPGLYPTQDVTCIVLKDNVQESIYYILALLNSIEVFNWFIYKGVIKGNIAEFSEAPLASIPIRRIRWDNPNDVFYHDEIVRLTKEYIEKKSENLKGEIQNTVSQLCEFTK